MKLVEIENDPNLTLCCSEQKFKGIGIASKKIIILFPPPSDMICVYCKMLENI